MLGMRCYPKGFMIYRHVWMIVLGLALQVLPARAESTTAGLTGFGEMRTPETLTGSRSEFTLSGRYSLLPEPLGKRISPALGYTQGIGDHAEAGLVLPFLMHDGESGLGNIPVAGKYQFLDWNGLQLAGVALFELPTASQDIDFGTGQPGFGGELTGMLTQGSISVVTSIGYGKSDYCRQCLLVGDQLGEPTRVPVLRLAEGFSVNWTDTMAFAELHFKTASTGFKSGFLQGDPDVYALAGARTALASGFSITGYGGLGVPQSSANTRQAAALIVHYTLGEKPPAAPGAARAEVRKGPLAKVDVINGCNNVAAANLMVALLKDNYEVRLAGKMSKDVAQTTISYLSTTKPIGSELAKIIPGAQRLSILRKLPPGVSARVITGCELGAASAKKPAPAARPKAAPRPPPVPKAVPLAPKKPKEQINVAVVNSCARPGLAEETATVLIIDGYNVTRMTDAPKPANENDTIVRYKSQYLQEATTLAGKLAGNKQYIADDTLPEDADILVTVGCGQ